MLRGIFAVTSLFILALPAHAGVFINEVAWMGTEESASNEWIELFSDTGVNLSGWILSTEDGGLNLRLKGTTTPGGYFLIERTDDNSVPGVKADMVSAFGKGLSNDGEILILKDADGNVADKVEGSNSWAIGGDKESKNTLQRNSSAPKGWVTAHATPGEKNAVYSAPKPKISPPDTAASSKSGPQEKASFAEDTSEKNIAKKINNTASAFDAEYIWLLGGILGGTVFGLLCVIISKWKKSPS